MWILLDDINDQLLVALPALLSNIPTLLCIFGIESKYYLSQVLLLPNYFAKEFHLIIWWASGTHIDGCLWTVWQRSLVSNFHSGSGHVSNRSSVKSVGLQSRPLINRTTFSNFPKICAHVDLSKEHYQVTYNGITYIIARFTDIFVHYGGHSQNMTIDGLFLCQILLPEKFI